jgi:hypothetical protein
MLFIYPTRRQRRGSALFSLIRQQHEPLLSSRRFRPASALLPACGLPRRTRSDQDARTTSVGAAQAERGPRPAARDDTWSIARDAIDLPPKGPQLPNPLGKTIRQSKVFSILFRQSKRCECHSTNENAQCEASRKSEPLSPLSSPSAAIRYRSKGHTNSDTNPSLQQKRASCP